MNLAVSKYDPLLIRCPRLGGEVTFAYCRAEGGDLPCPRIVPCWRVCMPIADYLVQTLTPDQIELFTSQVPREKIISLVELLEAVKQ